jgi:hypothetical protein
VSIEQLGSLGELVSPIAVVISLIYLAIQVRHNSVQIEENIKAIRRSEQNQSMLGHSELRRLVIGSERLADILVRSRSSAAALSEEEQERVRAYYGEVKWMNYQLWSRVRDGFLATDRWQRTKHVVPRLIRSTAGRETWLLQREYLEPQYVNEVESTAPTDDWQRANDA